MGFIFDRMIKGCLGCTFYNGTGGLMDGPICLFTSPPQKYKNSTMTSSSMHQITVRRMRECPCRSCIVKPKCSESCQKRLEHQTSRAELEGYLFKTGRL